MHQVVGGDSLWGREERSQVEIIRSVLGDIHPGAVPALSFERRVNQAGCRLLAAACWLQVPAGRRWTRREETAKVTRRNKDVPGVSWVRAWLQHATRSAA